MPGESLSLYRYEDDLAALVETGEGGVPAELEEQYRDALAQALERTVAKRDRVGEFIRHLEDQARFAGEESKRLAQRKQLFERAADRMRDYVRWTLETIGQRKLEGRTVTFSLRKMPDVLQVNDEASVPPAYKTLVIEVPADAWSRHIESCGDRGILDAIVRAESKLDRRALLAALKNGAALPGVAIRSGDNGVVVR
jgi:hypothetical protein